MTVVVVATVRGVIQQTDEIGDSVDAAMDNAVDELDVDEEALEDARAAAEETSPAVAEGFVTKIVSGVDALIGLASGLILGALIMYYLLKDGTSLRRSVVAQVAPSIRDEVDSFISDACRILRELRAGPHRHVRRSSRWSSASPASCSASRSCFTIVVVNFIGGYIPYIGAFLGGGLAVIVAYGEGGLGLAAVMLLVVLAANLLLENFVEPRVMGRTLDIHPLLVIVVTALGGFLFGIVGLILAVPFTVIAGNAHRPPSGERLLQARGRPSRADRAEDAGMTVLLSDRPGAQRSTRSLAGSGGSYEGPLWRVSIRSSRILI